MDTDAQAQLDAETDEVEVLEGEGGGVRAVLAPFLTFLALILAWEVVVRWWQIPTWLLPAPSAIAAAFAGWWGELLRNTLITLYETVAGFALAIALGIPLAVAVVYSPFLHRTIYPILLALQSVPKVAIAPLLALWIGFGALPKIIVVFLVCFFPIVVSTAAGLTSVPAPMMDLIKSLSATQPQTFRKIRFPTALPQIFVGLKIAITFAVIGAVIGEFVGSDAGLGYLILVSSSQSRTPVAFAALIVLTILSILLYYGMEFIERRVVPWADRS